MVREEVNIAIEIHIKQLIEEQIRNEAVHIVQNMIKNEIDFNVHDMIKE